MIDTKQITEHLEVVGSDGEHVGTVDHVDGNTIKLTKNDRTAAGQHHWVPLEDVEGVIDGKVRLNIQSGQVRERWLETGATHEV